MMKKTVMKILFFSPCNHVFIIKPISLRVLDEKQFLKVNKLVRRSFYFFEFFDIDVKKEKRKSINPPEN